MPGSDLPLHLAFRRSVAWNELQFVDFQRSLHKYSVALGARATLLRLLVGATTLTLVFAGLAAIIADGPVWLSGLLLLPFLAFSAAVVELRRHKRGLSPWKMQPVPTAGIPKEAYEVLEPFRRGDIVAHWLDKDSAPRAMTASGFGLSRAIFMLADDIDLQENAMRSLTRLVGPEAVVRMHVENAPSASRDAKLQIASLEQAAEFLVPATGPLVEVDICSDSNPTEIIFAVAEPITLPVCTTAVPFDCAQTESPITSNVPAGVQALASPPAHEEKPPKSHTRGRIERSWTVYSVNAEDFLKVVAQHYPHDAAGPSQRTYFSVLAILTAWERDPWLTAPGVLQERAELCFQELKRLGKVPAHVALLQGRSLDRLIWEERAAFAKIREQLGLGSKSGALMRAWKVHQEAERKLRSKRRSKSPIGRKPVRRTGQIGASVS